MPARPDVPYSPLQSVSPDVQQPNDYLRVQASPQDFGSQIGGALQQAGQTGEQAASRANDLAIQQQDLINQTVSDHAYNNAQSQVLAKEWGDPNDSSKPGFYQLTGQDALNAYPQFRQDLEDIRSQGSADLGNDRQRLLFDTATRRLMMLTADSAGRHVTEQAKNYSLAVNAATEQNQLTAIGSAWNDDARFQDALQQGARSAVRGVQARYGVNADDQLIQSATSSWIDKAWETRISSAATSDPAAALAMLQQNQRFLDPLAAARLQEHLTGKVNKLGAQANGAAAFNVAIGGGSGGSGSVASGDIHAAIYAQESSSGADPSTSNKGAVGGMQIMPETFRQYAKPGELITNPADNKAVGDRIIDDLSARFGGDPARIAVGYFSGPSNVAPAGSPTPWLQDHSDGKTSTSGYVRSVMQRLGTNAAPKPAASGDPLDPLNMPGAPKPAAAPSSGPTYPDDDKAEAAITQLPAEQQAGAWSEYQRRAHLYRSQIGQQAAGLSQKINDYTAAVLHGVDVDPNNRPSEATIRAMLPPAKADAAIATLADADETGNMVRSLHGAGPEELQKFVQAAQANMADTSGDPTGYANRVRLSTKMQQAFALDQKQRADDPAAYAATMPGVMQAQQALAAKPDDPAAMQAYATATLAEQERLGIQEDKRHILTVPQATNVVHQVISTDPEKGDVGGMLNKAAQQYGDAWPQAFNDLVTIGKLPRQYQFLASMDAPGQIASRQDFQRTLALIAQPKGAETLKATAGPEAKNIDGPSGALQDAMQPFLATTRYNQGGMQLGQDMTGAVKDLAYYYASKGTPGAQAVTMAVDGLINNKYDISGTMRVPKGTLDDVQRQIDAAQTNLKPDDLAPQQGNQSLTQAERNGIVADFVRGNAVWVPNRDDTGLVAMRETRVPGNVVGAGGAVPVRLKDGSFLQIKFGQNVPAPGAVSTSTATPDLPTEIPPIVVGLISGDPTDSATLEAIGSEAVPASTSEAMGAAFGEGLANNPVPRTSRAFERLGNQPVESWDVPGSAPDAPPQMIDADEANRVYRTGSMPAFTHPVTEADAQDLHDAAHAEAVRQDILARSPGGFVSGAGQLGAGLVAGVMDPLNLATGLIPGVGEERIAAQLGSAAETMLARAAVRGLSGATAGAAGMAGLEPLNYLLDRSEGQDWSMGQALRDIAFGGALGGGLHTIFGTAMDAAGRTLPDWASRQSRAAAGAIEGAGPDARQAALQGGLAQVLDDRPVEVAPAFEALEAAKTSTELQGWWRQQQITQAGVDTALEAATVPGAADLSPALEAAQTRLQQLRVTSDSIRSDLAEAQARLQPDTTTPDRLTAIDTELAGTIPAARRTSLEAERGMLTAGRDASADALEDARNQQQAQGLQVAASRADTAQQAAEAKLNQLADQDRTARDAASARQGAADQTLTIQGARLASREAVTQSMAERTIRRLAGRLGVSLEDGEATTMARRVLHAEPGAADQAANEVTSDLVRRRTGVAAPADATPVAGVDQTVKGLNDTRDRAMATLASNATRVDPDIAAAQRAGKDAMAKGGKTPVDAELARAQQQIAEATEFFNRARGATGDGASEVSGAAQRVPLGKPEPVPTPSTLDPEHEAELQSIAAEHQRSQGVMSGLMQAAACLLRGGA